MWCGQDLVEMTPTLSPAAVAPPASRARVLQGLVPGTGGQDRSSGASAEPGCARTLRSNGG